MPQDQSVVYKSLDKFDRLFGALEGLPVVTKSKPSTIVTASPMIGETQTFVIQTLRQKEVGDWIFLQYMDSNGAQRIAIPPAAAEAIARQRDSLTVKVRRNIGKATAAARKARGELPGFMKQKRKKPNARKSPAMDAV